MKKTILTSMLLLSVLIFSACTVKDVPARKIGEDSNSSSSFNIKFEYFYRGFATIKNNNSLDTYPNGTLIIETDEDWHDFMDKYVPGISYTIPKDFSNYYLVFDSSPSAKLSYTYGVDIKTFIINGNKLEPEYIHYALTGIANGIYAQNVEGAEHRFVNIVRINKKDIPGNIENVYHKK